MFFVSRYLSLLLLKAYHIFFMELLKYDRNIKHALLSIVNSVTQRDEFHENRFVAGTYVTTTTLHEDDSK